MRVRTIVLFLFLSTIVDHAVGQITERALEKPPDSLEFTETAKFRLKQKDLIDIMAFLVKSPGLVKHNSVSHKTGRVHFSLAPGIGYTLSTGFAGIIATNAAFYTSEADNAKLSNIFANVVYTQNKQLIPHIQGNIWTKDNKYNIVNDWRYLKYPQKTYGLGGHTDLENSFDQDYQ